MRDFTKILIFFIASGLLVSLDSSAQNGLRVTDLNHVRKDKMIPTYGSVGLKLKPRWMHFGDDFTMYTGLDSLEYNLELYGLLTNVEDSVLYINISSCLIDFVEDTVSEYQFGCNVKNYTVNPIPLVDIYGLSYYTKQESKIDRYTSILALTGFTAALISPLLSIDYKNGTFNTNRFLWTMGGGVSLFTIGLAANKLNARDNYYRFKISDQRKKAKRSHWTLRSISN